MNQGFYQCAQSPTMKGGSVPPSPQLRSCLRQGTFSRGRITVSGGGGASTTTHSSAPAQAMLQYAYHHQQARQEEETRSAASDPIMRSARDFPHRTADRSTSSPHSRRTVGTTINSGEISEREFTRMSRLLVSQHMSGSHHNDSSYALQLLHQLMPSVQQRMSFYDHLQRIASYLPMFPEPNEHPSLATARYIEKIFGPILARDVKNGSGGNTGSGPSLCNPQHYYLQPPQSDHTVVRHSQQTPHHHSTTHTFAMSRRPQTLRYDTDEPMFPPPPTPSIGTKQTPDISAAHQVSSTTNREVIPPISPHHPSVQPSNQYINWNTTQLSVTIPSPTSLQASMLPTPMTSNTSTKVTPIIQQSHNVTFLPDDWSSSKNEKPKSLPLFEPTQYQMGPPPNSPLPQPFSIASPLNNRMQKNDPPQTIFDSGGRHASPNIQRTVTISSQSSNSTSGNERENGQVFADEKNGDIKSITRGDVNTIKASSSSSMPSAEYQSLSNKDMLPSMKPRETILYCPNSPKSECCDGVLNTTRHHRIRKRPPSYLQVYVKCERSEPFINKDLDIVTWYRNASDSHVTAERTLVVRGTANLMELICGIVESFGLTSPNNDVSESSNGGGNDISSGCYKEVCFVSDIKTTNCKETAKINLTPLPIPGLQYKYVDRSDDDNSKKKEKGERESSSVLAMDPYGLRLTLVAQLLDKPIHPYSSSLSPKNDNKEEEGARNRLALVYCTPKRRAYVSSRSTHQGVLPETIYHFQIILEGIVAEDDLPSSFQSQTAIRCVGATGGVHGGSVIDTREEIDALNRILWNGRDVVGLPSPTANRHENLEQIIDTLGVPLFDIAGNQTPKEFVVDRCLYNIYSGKLSMEVAQKTQHTVEAIEGTTEWLARRVDALAKTLTACEDSYILFETEKFDEFDAAVSRLEKKWIFT